MSSNVWCTILYDWELPKSLLLSKIALFKMSWQILGVLPLGSYLPLLGALEWGTVWPYNLIKIKTGQSWNV